jgi:hypothetical protein
MVSLLALTVAAVGTGLAIRTNGGNYHPGALTLVMLAVAGALVAVFTLGRPGGSGGTRRGRALLTIIAAVVLLQWVSALYGPALPGSFPVPGSRKVAPQVVHAAMAGAALLVVLSAFWASRVAVQSAARPAERIAFLGGLCVYAIMLAAAVEAVPWPVFDFYELQRVAGLELLTGANPYTMRVENWFPGWNSHVDASLVQNGVPLFGFIYPPLALLQILPVQLFGLDFRYAYVLLAVATAALVGTCGRGPVPKLAAALLVSSPYGAYVIAAGWSEPGVGVWLAATVWLACRRPGATGVGLGLFAAAKQYVPLTAPLALLLVPREGPADRRRRLLALLVPAAVVAAVVTLPLALWDLPAFWFSTVSVQLRQPFRPDSLSVLALLYKWGVKEPPAVLGFVALAVGQAVALWRAPRSPAGFAAGMTLSLLLFFAFSKQAFANYYTLAIIAAVTALAAAGREPSEPAVPTAPTQASSGKGASAGRRRRGRR